MFWIQLAALVIEILFRLWKHYKNDPSAQRVAEENLKNMRLRAIMNKDLSELRAYRDSLKASVQ